MPDPLVMLPAMMCDAGIFRHQINDLSRLMPVTIAPVTGAERIEDLSRDLLAQLPGRFALFGLSFGGLVAMDILRRAPERVSRACLMSCSPLAETPAEAANREPLIISARLGKLDEAMSGTLRPEHLAPGPARMAHIAEYHEIAARVGAQAFVRQSRALQTRRDQQGTLRRCKVPALIATGTEDPLVTVNKAEFLAALMPRAEVAVIEGAGHVPPLEQPVAVLNLLRNWFAAPAVLPAESS